MESAKGGIAHPGLGQQSERRGRGGKLATRDMSPQNSEAMDRYRVGGRSDRKEASSRSCHEQSHRYKSHKFVSSDWCRRLPCKAVVPCVCPRVRVVSGGRTRAMPFEMVYLPHQTRRLPCPCRATDSVPVGLYSRHGESPGPSSLGRT